MTDCPWHETKRHKTLTSIISSAISLVIEADSIDAVSVEQIAERAGISRRTFFNHVPGKTTALLAPLFDIRAHYVQAVIDAPADLGPWQSLEHGVLAALDSCEDIELAAQSEHILTHLIHRSAGGDMPDMSADQAHTRALRESLATRLGTDDPVALSLLLANGDHILRLALRGGGTADLVRHAFSLL